MNAQDNEIIRNTRGTVKFPNKTTMTVPTNRSMLSILGVKSNLIADNLVYVNDGYIYHNSQRIKKWLIPFRRQGSTIWEPKLNNIAQLEQRRWDLLQWYNNKNVFQRILDILPPGTLVGQDRKGNFHEIKRREGSFSHCVLLEDEINKMDIDLRCSETVQKFLDLYELYMTFLKRVGAYRDALELAIRKKHFEAILQNSVVHFIINKRHYWYMRDEYAEFGLRCFSYPETNEKTITILIEE